MGRPRHDPDNLIFLGVDASGTPGLAYYGRVDGQHVAHGERVESLVDVGHCAALRTLEYLPSRVRVVAAVEYPPAGLHGAGTVRFAANLILAAIKDRLPRRVEVHKPTPTTWQARILGDRRTYLDTKVASLLAAHPIAGRPIATDDEADAWCLARWAELHVSPDIPQVPLRRGAKGARG